MLIAKSLPQRGLLLHHSTQIPNQLVQLLPRSFCRNPIIFGRHMVRSVGFALARVRVPTEPKGRGRRRRHWLGCSAWLRCNPRRGRPGLAAIREQHVLLVTVGTVAFTVASVAADGCTPCAVAAALLARRAGLAVGSLAARPARA